MASLTKRWLRPRNRPRRRRPAKRREVGWGAALCCSPSTGLSDQKRRFGVGNGFKTAVAFAAAPMMTDLPLIPILGAFGGNQPIVAAHAIYAKTEATIGYCHRQCNLPALVLA